MDKQMIDASPTWGSPFRGRSVYRRRQAPIALVYILYLCFIMGDLIFESLTEIEFQCSSSEASRDAAWGEEMCVPEEEACRYADYHTTYLHIDFWCLAFFVFELALEITVAGRFFILDARGRICPSGMMRLCDAGAICLCFAISFLALFVYGGDSLAVLRLVRLVRMTRVIRILLAFNRITTRRMRVVVNSNVKRLLQAAQQAAPSDQAPITWADGSPVQLPLPLAGNGGFHVFLSVRGAHRG